jgi:hypothetical protein
MCSEKCNDCPLQHDISHKLLFGPLASILGLLTLLDMAIESGNIEEAQKMTRLLVRQSEKLKTGVKKILQHQNNL